MKNILYKYYFYINAFFFQPISPDLSRVRMSKTFTSLTSRFTHIRYIFVREFRQNPPLSLSSFALKKKFVNQPFCCNLWYEKLYKKQRTIGMIMWKKVSFRETIIDLKSIFFYIYSNGVAMRLAEKECGNIFRKNVYLLAPFLPVSALCVNR